LAAIALVLGFYGSLALAQQTPTGDITVEYKEELATVAQDLKADVRDLLDHVRKDLVGDKIVDNKLLCTKYWIIRARKQIEDKPDTFPWTDPVTGIIYPNLPAYVVRVQSKIQSAQKCKQTAYLGFPQVAEALDDLETSIVDIILDMERHISTGEITQSRAKTLKTEILEKIIEFITDKKILLIDMDMELEMVDEYLVEADAFVKEDNWRDAKGVINKAERQIKKVIAKVWEFKENLKYIMGYIQGFIVSVLTSELMPPPKKPPYYPGHLSIGSGLSVMASDRTIRFAVTGAGIEALKVEVFNLGGRKVFEDAASNMLSWDTHTVANGVYLYVATIRGYNGELLRKVGKVVVMR